MTISNAGDPGLRGKYRGDTVHVREMQRILRDYGEGYVYYQRRNPASGAIEPKASLRPPRVDRRPRLYPRRGPLLRLSDLRPPRP